jgi:RNA 2',3'-cyclic 3'-phosphodiesterase
MPSRAFLALTLPDPSRTLLADACTAIRGSAHGWIGEKWVAPELLHVTVKFVGPLPEAAVPRVLEALRAEGARHMPFSLEITDVHPVPSKRRAAMLWARLAGETESCEMLAAGFEGVVEDLLGVDRDSRSFRPHVTLARARRPRGVPALALEAAGRVLADPSRASARAMSVASATLFASTLGPAGPTYDRLGEIPLSGR